MPSPALSITPFAELCPSHGTLGSWARGVNLTYLAFITKVIAENLRKHGVSFEEAASVFCDHLAITDADPYEEGQR